MLDGIYVVTTGGCVLWSRVFSEVNHHQTTINKFIEDVFILETVSPGRDGQPASQNPPYKRGQDVVKYAFVKEFGLIVVAVHPSLLHLTWIDKLVDNVKTLFVDLYGDQIKKPNTLVVECEGFDEYFDQQLRELEGTGSSNQNGSSAALPDDVPSVEDEAHAEDAADEPPPQPGMNYKGRALKASIDLPSNDSTPALTPNTSRPSTPGGGGGNLVVGKSGPAGAKLSRRARKAQHAVAASSAPASSGDEAYGRREKGAKSAKKGRKWDDSGMADEEDDVQLDYSAGALKPASSDFEADQPVAGGRSSAVEHVDQSTWGSKTSKGEFVLKDLDDEVHSILDSAQSKKAGEDQSASKGLLGSSLNTISGLFRNVVGGRTLTKEDIDKAMKGMEEHLLNKNVAREAAIRLCDGVQNELIGVTTGSFESINTRIHTAMEASLTKMLTPTSSLDLLRDIDSVTRPSATSLRKPRPYVMSIVGVNGVGKSTNLSKICFFLLQNKYRVLVAAGDTFRSGAVEQLAVHVRNLKELTAREGGQVELYQKGYGKDAAQVARDAVAHAAAELYDVVLIDTAGRRHNDQRLMSSLEKFANFAKPDKILMVGEALVGTDSVAQARNFNAAFGSARNLDGFIISKCDTVGTMVGTLVSLVHATGVPVLFVGVGQHYSDLRNFSVKWAVEKLLSGS